MSILANSNEILDPFCGSGGILLEAGLIGLKVIGYDLDWIMIKRAKINLDYFKVKGYKLKKNDALKLNESFEAIVTDLPYGKNSKVKDINKTFQSFLSLSYKYVKKMVVVFPDFAHAQQLISKSDWKINNQFKHYIHKSLTKEIFVLEK